MTGKRDRAFARRRGTSVAACALGLSLVVTGVQPVAAPQAASQAAAQLSDRTEADRSLVRYPLGTTGVRYSETTSVLPNVNALTVYPPTSYKLVDGANPGWGAEVNSKTGELSITPDPNAELPETDTINVQFTFGDGSTKVVDAKITLEPSPVYVDQSDKVYWTGKEINPVDIRVNKAPWSSALTIDDSTLRKAGFTADERNFGNIKHIFLKGTPTEVGTFEVKTQLKLGGTVLEGSNGPLEQTFTITVKDSADLPAPVEENIVEDPAPVKPGESVDIDIPTENASSVEVTNLPKGLTYDSEKSKITGKPTTSGTARVNIITNDAKVITDTIDIQVEEAGGSTTPATTIPEDSTPEPTTSAQPTTTKPTTAKPTTAKPTVKVTAPVSDADRISDAQYKDTYVQAGKKQSSRRPIASIDRDGIEYAKQPLPAGTKFSTKSAEGTVDQDTGVVTVKAPLRTPAGETITIPVDFTYPDGTKGEADAVFHVDAGAQNEAYKPAYQESTRTARMSASTRWPRCMTTRATSSARLRLTRAGMSASTRTPARSTPLLRRRTRSRSKSR